MGRKEDEEEDIEEDYEEELDDEDYDDELFDDESQSPLAKHADLLKDLTNFDPYLKESINSWLGLRWDDKTEAYIIDEDLEPTLSRQGVNYCLSFLKTYTRGNNIITNISKDDYISILEDAIEEVYLNLGTREELGHNNELISEGDLIAIGNKLVHSAALILMGAGDGKYNQFLSTTVTRNETVNPNQMYPYNQPRNTIKKGMLGRIQEALVGNNGGMN